MDSEAEREIVLRYETLTFKLQAYDPNDIDEDCVKDKTYLSKIKEVEDILDDFAGKADKYLYKFPGRQYLEDLINKALSDVRNFSSLVKARAWEVKKGMNLIRTVPLAHAESRSESVHRRRVEAMEMGNAKAEAELPAAEARVNERNKSVIRPKSTYENLRIETEDDEKGEDVIIVAKNLKDKVGLVDANSLKATVTNENESLDDFKATIAEDCTATKFLPRTDLNYNLMKNEVENPSDMISENLTDQKEEGVLVKENNEEKVSAKESFVMKTVRIFKNKKYQKSKIFIIQGNEMSSSGFSEVMSENHMNGDNTITEDDADEYVNVQGEIFNASEEEILFNVARDSKEELRDDETVRELDDPMKLDVDLLHTYEGIMTVDAKKYSEVTLEKARTITESVNKEVNLSCGEVYVSSPALQLEELDTKNRLDDIVATTVDYEVDGGNEKPASNASSNFNSVKEPEVDNAVFVALLIHHDAARLDRFKRFPRFLWRPGDPSYPSYSVLKNIFTQLVFMHRVMYTDVLPENTAIPQVFNECYECCVFTISVLDMSCIYVDRKKKPDVKNIQVSEYEEFTRKLMEKVNKEVFDDDEEVGTKHCENCCCFPNCVLNGHGMTVSTLTMDVKLFKESLFPGLLHRAWDELEDYKAGMFDDLPLVQDKLVCVLHATLTDLDQDGFNAEEDQFSFSASANTPD